VFGLAPALQASRTSLADALKSGGRGQLTGRSRLRSAFVTGQIAMSLLLLIAAGLFVRALIEASARDPGFNPDGVAVAAVDLEPHGYDQTTGAQFFRQLSERVAALPGVESVALAEAVPLGFSQHSTSVGIEGHAPASGEENVTINFNTVGAGYFETLQIPLLRGRGFGAGDQDGAPPVAVVNQAFAERYWPRDEPVGKRLRIGGEQLTVVGVTGTGRYNTLDEEPLPFLYLPFGQHYTPSMTVHLRSAAPAAPLLAQLQREVRAIDPNVPVGASMPLAQMIGLSLLPQRLAAVLIGGFAVLGLLLAAIGVYGIIAFSVAQRTREIGIRIALGAGAGAVRRLVVGQAGRLVTAGVVLGVLAAFGVTRLLASLLYGVAPADPLTFGAAALLLIAVALLASYFPARRATRVDPVVALRAE
jgi:predicted permease